MNNILKLLLLLFFISGCSLKDTTGFWTNENEIRKVESNFKPLFKNEERLLKEFNKDFKIKLDASLLKNDNSTSLNNHDGYTRYKGNLKKISKYNFSKIKDYNKLEPDLIFHDNGIIFFDNSGNILNFDNNSKLIWKKNIYLKNEKKIKPLLSMQNNKNYLIIADNLSKYYALNIKNGEIIWSKSHQSPFNSQIKIYKDKFFILDLNNNLICFSLKDGSKIWNFNTEKPFINPLKKLSIVIVKDQVIFNNSIGDITAVNFNRGELLWQLPTQSSAVYESAFSLETSEIITDGKTLFFSNNNNVFYSVDLNTGNINWKQNISSSVKPAVIGDLLFTISDNGYLFLIDKNRGNIVRINDIFKNFKPKVKKNLMPTGFILDTNNLYVSTNFGKLLIISIENGSTKEILKIGKGKLSRPFVKNQNLFLIKDNAIIKLN